MVPTSNYLDLQKINIRNYLIQKASRSMNKHDPQGKSTMFSYKIQAVEENFFQHRNCGTRYIIQKDLAAPIFTAQLKG